MELRNALPTAVAIGIFVGVGVGNAREQRAAGPAAAPAVSPIVARVIADAPATSFDLPVVWNASVERFVSLFRDKQSDRMALYLRRSGRYEGMIRAKLRERGMPQDLFYLSMIESGFNPTARSHASAVGLWQFMAGTARGYGLRVDGYVDERRDPEKSTDAALRYLKDLHEQFGSWNLAAAAYNSGHNRVARIMREETGSEKGSEADFWRIRSRLPRETREYVPLLHAATMIGKEPQKYGLGNVERWLPVRTDSVTVPPRTDLAVVAAAVGSTEEELRKLNPALIRGITPPGNDYTLRIPEGRAASFAASFERIRAESKAKADAEAAKAKASKAKASKAKSAARKHRVRKGDSLWEISRRYGVSVTAVQRANGMGRRTSLKPGQVLTIPR